MSIEVAVAPLDLLLAVLGRSLLGAIAVFFALIAFWGCAVVVVEMRKDIRRRLEG